MEKQYSLKNNGTFIINDYNRAKTFSNFLPGVSGVWGIPLWVFYVNRAQGVVSFGIKDKNHSISEFFPANKAYSFVSSYPGVDRLLTAGRHVLPTSYESWVAYVFSLLTFLLLSS